jgi:hypothetical protein
MKAANKAKWSLTLRGKLWIRVFEYRVLRRYVGLRGTV